MKIIKNNVFFRITLLNLFMILIFSACSQSSSNSSLTGINEVLYKNNNKYINIKEDSGQYNEIIRQVNIILDSRKNICSKCFAEDYKTHLENTNRLLAVKFNGSIEVLPGKIGDKLIIPLDGSSHSFAFGVDRLDHQYEVDREEIEKLLELLKISVTS
ncbi:hypothetical protein [Paenibacillus sp. MMS18-CY102]|uniref:hypothetical protein n=1 Tax=Paenibacillus sp. MMS18-CY102 TaxID=2682849 RepID=UPI00136542D2|nr:hypothetical protein [Paenibacillus sp. MMS18-CY102]MWC29657.1 hypothetical protein [Paenibacillus sp. MMS18-CY102]